MSNTREIRIQNRDEVSTVRQEEEGLLSFLAAIKSKNISKNWPVKYERIRVTKNI